MSVSEYLLKKWGESLSCCSATKFPPNPLPVGEANDAIHIDMTTTFSERRCVFRFAHTELSQSGNKWGNKLNHVTAKVTR